jgi:protein SCO1/2
MSRFARLLLVATGVVLAVAAGVAAWSAFGPRELGLEEDSLERLGDYGRVPDFALVERSERRVGLADLLGTVWIANFIYTQCTETCPVQSLQIRRLQDELAGVRDLRFVSITVDPDRDTPAVLRQYAERYEADPGHWLFLTGPKQAIYALAKDGFKLSVVETSSQPGRGGVDFALAPTPAFASHGSTGLIVHSFRFVLVDRQARIRAYHLATDEESMARLRANLRGLLAEPARREG